MNKLSVAQITFLSELTLPHTECRGKSKGEYVEVYHAQVFHRRYRWYVISDLVSAGYLMLVYPANGGDVSYIITGAGRAALTAALKR